MFRTVGSRLLQALIVVFCLETFTMIAIRLTPGGPFTEEKAMQPHIRERMEQRMGIDKPVLTQVLDQLENASSPKGTSGTPTATRDAV